MSLLWYPLAAMAGGVVGTIMHESIHAVLAVALGELVGVGWQCGLAGGPFVDFRADSRLAAEVIRKGPLAVGIASAVVAIAHGTLSLAWIAAGGAIAGLLWTSPEDLFASAAQEAAA